jgi:hypothetical protein
MTIIGDGYAALTVFLESPDRAVEHLLSVPGKIVLSPGIGKDPRRGL